MNQDIEIKHYDYDRSEYVLDATINSMDLARAMDEQDMAVLIGNWANAGGKGMAHGRRVGRALAASDTHRAIQQLVVNILLGIIYEIAKTTWVDARNRSGVDMCKKIVAMISEEEEYFWPLVR